MRHMAKSIRISDDLYSMARLEAAVMHRSVAQQIEHWASIGQVLEVRGDLPEVRELSIAQMRLRDHDRVRTGKAKARDYHFIPAEMAKRAKMVWPKDAFAEYEPKK
jgi:hypothetical protein